LLLQLLQRELQILQFKGIMSPLLMMLLLPA